MCRFNSLGACRFFPGLFKILPENIFTTFAFFEKPICFVQDNLWIVAIMFARSLDFSEPIAKLFCECSLSGFQNCFCVKNTHPLQSFCCVLFSSKSFVLRRLINIIGPFLLTINLISINNLIPSISK